MSNQRNSNRRNNTQRNNGNNQDDGYFTLKSTGIGYINNLQERVPKENGDLYTTGTVAVLVGPKNAEKRQYRFIDVTVSGQQTLDLIWQYEQDLIDKRKVLIKFCMSDMSTKAYIKEDGTPGASLRAKLYAIEKIWVDGELTYEANAEQEQAPTRTGETRSNNQQRQSSSRSGGNNQGSYHGSQDNNPNDHHGDYEAPRDARNGQSQNRSYSQQPRNASRQQSSGRRQSY